MSGYENRRLVLSASSDLFTYSHKTFISEASTVPVNMFQSIYYDACDVGFAIRSVKTDKCEVFYLDSISKNPDNEIEFWVFKPINKQLRDAGISAKIFND